MTRQKIGTFAVVVVLSIAVFSQISTIFIVRSHMHEAETVCVKNLRQIDGAKQTWAIEYHASSNATPTWSQIQPYLGRGSNGTLPVCPQDGVYTIGSMRVAPTCSIKGHVLE